MTKRTKKPEKSSLASSDLIESEIRNYFKKARGLTGESQNAFKHEEQIFYQIVSEKYFKNKRPGSQKYNDNADLENALTDSKSIPVLMFLTLLKEKNQLKLELDQAKTAYDEVLSLITHEFKNILTSIHGYNMMIEKQLTNDKNEKIYHNLMASDRLTQQLFNMADSLLKMSLGEKGLLKPEYKLIDFVVDILKPVKADLAKRLKKKKMAIEKIKNTKNYMIHGDEWLLDIVIRNLLLNAIKYGKEDTTIFIEMRSEANNFVFSVKNKCEKLPKNLCDGLFQKFHSRKIGSVKGGTGLGLFNVKNIIELHSGKINCYILPDEWIEFKFVLPQMI